MNLVFEKYQGLGNDYLVYDCFKNTMELTREQIRQICDRHFGIGADGILVGPIKNSEDAGTIAVRIFNPDGSEAEKSGNGVRIFAKFLRDHGYVRKDFCTIHTIGGKVKVSYLDRFAEEISVSMGQLSFDSKVIGVSGPKREVVNEVFAFDDTGYQCTCVSIGNPHCVIPMNTVSEDKVREIGKCSEHATNFSKGINTQIMQVLDRNHIKIEIFERGAGYTLSSGTSSCAAAAAAKKLGLVDEHIMVDMPGGRLVVDIDHNWNTTLTGPVGYIGTFLYAMKVEK